jgi:AraC-like DNA-binding protein
VLLERLFENLDLKVDPFATCAVAAGWRLRLPSRDWVTLHYTLQGEGVLQLGTGERMPLFPGSLAVIPPGTLHSVECGSEVRNESMAQGDDSPVCALVAGPPDDVALSIACGRIQVTYAGTLGLFDQMTDALVLDFSESPPMHAVFEGLVREQESGSYSHAMMTALMNQCLILVFRHLAELSSSQLPWLSALDDARLARALKKILEHPEAPHTVESLATLAGMSRSAYARTFLEAFGRTPIDYVREVRLRRAARLLHRGDLSVNEIAGRIGFASRSHFSRAFRDQFGCSPTKFRSADGR